jgi:predicted flap endonuclease-1-like 5' DNA nuclease
MSEQPEDVRQWIQELITRSASDKLQNLQRFEELLRRLSRGEIEHTNLREEYLRFAQQESNRYINDLTRVGLSFYNTLLELNRQYNERFFEYVYKDQHLSPDETGGKRREPKVIAMDLHGPLGGVAGRSFVIENQRAESVSVSFMVSAFESEDGATSFRPPLQLEPSRFSMRPGEEHLVAIKISLLEKLFEVGSVYTAVVVVSGFEDLHLRLRVWAEPVEKENTSPKSKRERKHASGLTLRPIEDEDEAIQADDLRRILGIGPVYANKLQTGGIRSFDQLANANQETLQRLIGRIGATQAEHQRWRQQARFANARDWANLEKLQESLS